MQAIDECRPIIRIHADFDPTSQERGHLARAFPCQHGQDTRAPFTNHPTGRAPLITTSSSRGNEALNGFATTALQRRSSSLLTSAATNHPADW